MNENERTDTEQSLNNTIKHKPSLKQVRFSESITHIEVDSFKKFNKENTAEPTEDIEQKRGACFNCNIY